VNHVWDVEFTSTRRLIVRTGPGEIVLRMDITDEALELYQCFFRKEQRFVSVTGEPGHTFFKMESKTGKTTTLVSDSTKERIIFPGPLKGPALRVV